MPTIMQFPRLRALNVMPVKWLLSTVLTAALAANAYAQNVTIDPVLGPPQKLHGFIMAHAPDGGYLAVSVPLREVARFIGLAEKLSPHLEMLEVLEHLDREANRIPAMPKEREVRFGVIFIDSKEIFLRHKILDRFVQKEGSYSYLNRRGLPVVVPAFVDKPIVGNSGE